MIKSVKIINYVGESLTIELRDGDPNHGIIIQNIDGLGPPKAVLNMTELPTEDGSIFNSSRLETRNITFGLLLFPAPSMEDTRRRCYGAFTIKKNISMIFETDLGLFSIDGYVESNEPVIFSKSESVSISIICQDPYFYSADNDGLTVTNFYSVEPLFEFPFLDDYYESPSIEFGNIISDIEKDIYYEGDSEIGFIIYIHVLNNTGDITIYNAITREQMKIYSSKVEKLTSRLYEGNGNPIMRSDDIIISTINGKKSIYLVRDAEYINIIGCIDIKSDWFKMRRGINIFGCLIENGLSTVNVRFEHRSAYEGI